MPASYAVSEVLGIHATGPLPLMAAISDGLPIAALDRVVHAIAPAEDGFAFRIVARATLARRRKALAAVDRAPARIPGSGPDPALGRLSTEEGSKLARLAAVWAVALDVWKSEGAARHFMFEPHALLQGRRPVDVVLESELGRPLVEGILGRLKYGSAA